METTTETPTTEISTETEEIETPTTETQNQTEEREPITESPSIEIPTETQETETTTESPTTETSTETQALEGNSPTTEIPTETQAIETTTESTIKNNTEIETYFNEETIEIIKEIGVLSLLGFSNVKYSDSKIYAFYCIYFVVLSGQIFSHKLIHKIAYQYKSFRRLQELIEEEIECLLIDSEFSNQVRYNCSINANDKEIEFISSSFNFTFIGQEVRILSYSSFSIEKSQNLLEISENIFDKKLYILDNSLVYLYNNNYKFNINGTMDDETFPYDKIILTLNLDNHKNKILNTTCSSNKSDNNYILSCNSTREIKEKIITGFATFENEILFVNVTEQTGFSSSKFNFFSTKNSSKISACAIIGIIIALLVIIISLILLFCYLKKKKGNKSIEESSINYMKNYF